MMDLVPLYSVVGKTDNLIVSTSLRGVMGAVDDLSHTVINDDLVASLGHGFGVVALVELAESWQAGRAHPDLECLPLLEIRWGVGLSVDSAWIAILPVGGGRRSLGACLVGLYKSLSLLQAMSVLLLMRYVCVSLPWPPGGFKSSGLVKESLNMELAISPHG